MSMDDAIAGGGASAKRGRSFLARHADAGVVSGRRVVVPAAIVVLAIGAEAVEEVAGRAGPVDEGLAGEDVARHGGQVFGRQVAQGLRVAAVIDLVGGEGEGNAFVALDLLAAIAGLDDLG